MNATKMLTESFRLLAQARDFLSQDKPFAPREVHRLIHTIKGNVAYFQMEQVQKIAHEIEDELHPLFQKEHFSTSDLVTVEMKITKLETELLSYRKKFKLNVQDSHAEESINSYFENYPTLMQDLSLKLHKEINFEIEGTEIILPYGNWGEIFSQMIHLVRNSADHGIESPEQRILSGKNPSGTITMHFEVLKDHLFITFSDDGQGLDWKKLSHLNSQIQSEADAIAMIFKGGLSTKDCFSDCSGRGVGVSSVYTAVKNWGGEMQLINRPEAGVTFLISLPLKEKTSYHVAS